MPTKLICKEEHWILVNPFIYTMVKLTLFTKMPFTWCYWFYMKGDVLIVFICSIMQFHSAAIHLVLLVLGHVYCTSALHVCFNLACQIKLLLMRQVIFGGGCFKYIIIYKNKRQKYVENLFTKSIMIRASWLHMKKYNALQSPFLAKHKQEVTRCSLQTAFSNSFYSTTQAEQEAKKCGSPLLLLVLFQIGPENCRYILFALIKKQKKST